MDRDWETFSLLGLKDGDATVAELEFAGLKFKGGKIVVVITALGTLLGGAWAVFEFYKDYLNMKDTISAYVAP